VPRLEIGPFAFQDMVTSFQDIPDSLQWPVSVSRNGLIGNELLSRFDVWLDYVDERLYVRPVRKWQEAFRYDRSGLVLVAGGENLREMVISHVVEGSPAAHAGLQWGDRLVSVNGVPARWRSMASVTKVLRKWIGKRIKLVVERNGQRLRTEFRLEKLI
jgi:C-terminal processing protease CtpA/Prc